MDVSLASWLVIAVALAAANLPFPDRERVRSYSPEAGSRKRAQALACALLELLVLYFVVGAVAYLLESRIGNVFAQVRSST